MINFFDKGVGHQITLIRMADIVVMIPDAMSPDSFDIKALRDALEADRTFDLTALRTELDKISTNVFDLSVLKIMFNCPELEGDTKECFQYDLVALLFSVFINVEQRAQIPIDKFEQARDHILSFNKELFWEVHKSRFAPICALQWHTPSDMNVAQCMKYMVKYFDHQIQVVYTPELETIIKTSGDNMRHDLHNFVYRFAIEMTPLIVPCWRHVNAVYSKEAKEHPQGVECVVM